VILVVTLFTLAVSGLNSTGATPPAASASPARPATTPGLTAPPSAAPSATTAPEGTPTAPPSAAPSATAAASQGPVQTFRTYRVQAGDTLSGIASKFGTTSRAIAELNGISVSKTLHVGDVLKIPN
jgi:LysM repeat protein